MKYTIKSFVVVFVMINLMIVSFAMAADLSITPYTDIATQDFQSNDSLQVDLAYGSIAAAYVHLSEGSANLGGAALSDAGGYGSMGSAMAMPGSSTAIDYVFNTTSPWYKGYTLKDIAIYVAPSSAPSKDHYDFEVQYVSKDNPGVYVDSGWGHISDLYVDPNVGTQILIENIDVANIQRVRIWALPIPQGLSWVGTTIAEIDINVTDCKADPQQDLNGDCKVDMRDMALMVTDWLKTLQ